VQSTLSEIEEALPIRLSKQERDIRVLVNEMGKMTQTIKFARAYQSPKVVSMVVRQSFEVEKNLEQIRDKYRFNDVLGVSAIHAKLNPAIYDIRNWLSDGIYNFGPTSGETLRLVEQRARDAHKEAETLLLKVGETAIEVLGTQASRIEKFRNIMILTLTALAIMTMVLVLLGFRFYRAPGRRDISQPSSPGQVRTTVYRSRPIQNDKRYSGPRLRRRTDQAGRYQNSGSDSRDRRCFTAGWRRIYGPAAGYHGRDTRIDYCQEYYCATG
jgi:hypothetical protein